MKSKKALIKLSAILTFCSIMVFNFVVFPQVLSATPEKSKMQTVTVNPIPQAGIIEQPDINAISKEQAIEAAVEEMVTSQNRENAHEWAVVAKYIAGTAPANNPMWAVVFKVNNDIIKPLTSEDYTAGMDLDKFNGVEIETDENGNMFVRIAGINLYLVEVDAFTSEATYFMEIANDDNDPQKKDVLNWLIVTYGNEFEQLALNTN